MAEPVESDNDKRCTNLHTNVAILWLNRLGQTMVSDAPTYTQMRQFYGRVGR